MPGSQLRNGSAHGKMAVQSRRRQTILAMPNFSEDTPMQYEPIQPRHLSHDLRGPLNTVLGFTELLLDGIEGPLNEIQIEDISAIRRSAEDLLELINTMVDLSKLDVNQLPFHLAPVALDEILNQLVSDSTKTSLNIALEIPAEIPTVKGDRQRIEQILNHLVTFMQAQGASQIRIQVKAGSQAVTTQITTPEVILTDRQQAELFEATAAVDSTGRSKLTTGGLWLPLAAKLVANQDGQLDAFSQPKTGLTFVLTLPVSEAQ